MKLTIKKDARLDPLYVIFEQHLFNFQDSDIDRKTFLENVVAEYLVFLQKRKVLVPKVIQQQVIEELSVLVNSMLLKKIYGCLKVSDYLQKTPVQAKKKARSRYFRLNSI